MAVRALLVLALGAAACGHSARDVPAPVEHHDDTAPAPADAAPDECVARCVHDNQMRAEAIEKIEQDCRDRCAAP